ncbi:hypothetical protein [Maricaulis sp.]|uniref:hypothetical protein n=1 Tax=Maricaulis sp. TaxID=1486257 RepID=UPI00261EC383|nr:hypothetical protein [Maricaulis sp.]MDF1769833.1 hypothetical protein [Maricaulis sp.]
MPIYTHTSKIAALPRCNIGESSEVITEVHIAITTTDGSTKLTKQSFSYAIPEADLTGPYVDIDNLDADTILGWIPDDLMAEWKATMEALVSAEALRVAAAARSDIPSHLA